MEGHILSDVCHSAEFQRLLSSGNGVRDPLYMIQPVLLVNDRNSFQPWPCVASEATICFRFEAFEYKLEREYAQCVYLNLTLVTNCQPSHGTTDV